MTDWAPNYTFRYKARYRVGGITHDQTVRGPRVFVGGDSLAGDLSLAMGQFWDLMDVFLMSDFQFLNASYAYADSDVFIPTDAVPPNPSGLVSVASMGGRARATAWTMAGRGLGDGSARLYGYGFFLADTAPADGGQDGVVTNIEFTNLTAMAAIANASYRSSDGNAARFYSRFTLKVNDKALRLIRRTGG